MRIAVVTVALSVGLVVTASPAAAQAPDASATMIVLDGSGSMWARLDGDKQPKFYLVRDAFKPVLAAARADARIGLTAFGHRRQGDCSDVQVQLPPEAGGESRDKLNALIEKHNPRGKSPLANALREAAKALPKGAGPRSLIVVHDDLDNCGQDPCAVLADLKAAAPQIVVHTIGIGLKGDEAQRLQCLVKPTGGKLIDVQAGSGLPAAAEEAIKLASLGSAPPPPSGPTPAEAAARRPADAPQRAASAQPTAAAAAPRLMAVTRAPLRKDGPSGLRLATVLAPGQPPLARDIAWTIRSADPAASIQPIVAYGQDVAVALPPGPYVVEVRDGLSTPALAPVAVGQTGETGLDVPLQAGLLRATFPEVAATGRIQIVDAQGKVLAHLSSAQLAGGVPLPPGKWTARLGDGLATREVPFDVAIGATADLGQTWPFARLLVSLSGQTSSRFPATIVVYEDDPDAPRGRREVTRATLGGTLVVPAGTYSVVVRQGQIEARDRVALQAGETLQRTMAMAASRVTLTSRLPGAAAAAPTAAGASPEPVAYRLERLDVVPPDVFTAHRLVSELDVPSGRYRIEARHGFINARASREVTLTPGQTLAVTLEPQAGTVRLVGPQGAADLLWEILDETAHPLWSTAQVAPVATLQAGRYVVRLEHRGKRLERRVEVRAGDNRVVEVRD